MKICLVASSGGHLLELFSLHEAWANYDRVWVSFATEDASSLLEEEKAFWAYHPTNRSLPNLIRNIGLAWRILRREKPDVVVSTGAGVGVPFIWLGCLLRIETVFIEILTFTHRPSLSGRLIYWFVDHYYVQWPDLAEKYEKAIFRGQVL